MRSLKRILAKNSGRNSQGRITVRHQGGRHKRFLREIDFKRQKRDILGKVRQIEYDPNRNAEIALVVYTDGDWRYILAPSGLKVGDSVITGEKTDIKVGNTMPLKNIPVGTVVHNLELAPGKGGQLVRGAGTGAVIQGQEKDWVIVKLPSGEIRRIVGLCLATIGQVGREDKKAINLGKAGRKRHLGIRPTVRGVAQNPNSHPHGGGEGRSGIGMPSPKSPWGKKTLGKRTRNRKKYSRYLIIKRRK